MGVVHAQLGGTAVHLLYKHGLAAADEFGHSHRRIVGTAHAHRAQHFIQRELLPRLQPDLAAAHAVAVLAHRHKIFFMHLARLQGFKSQKQRHYLCNRCLRQLDIRVFGIQHRAAALLHQHGGLAGQIKFWLAKATFLGVGAERACSGQHCRHRQRSGALYPCAFHAVSSFLRAIFSQSQLCIKTYAFPRAFRSVCFLLHGPLKARPHSTLCSTRTFFALRIKSVFRPSMGKNSTFSCILRQTRYNSKDVPCGHPFGKIFFYLYSLFPKEKNENHLTFFGNHAILL